MESQRGVAFSQSVVRHCAKRTAAAHPTHICLFSSVETSARIFQFEASFDAPYLPFFPVNISKTEVNGLRNALNDIHKVF